MNLYVARAFGAVAAVLGIVAIWVDVTPGGLTYWHESGHAVGIAMLVLAILASAGIVLAALNPVRTLDQLWLLPGLIFGGIALFVPLAALGNGDIGDLEAGGWLGVASCGLFLAAGIVNALPAPAQVRATNAENTAS